MGWLGATLLAAAALTSPIKAEDAPRAFFLDDEEKDRAVALMRRVEAGVQASVSIG